MDSSIHEIQINDDDIRNLDEEFSDIGDFDNTVTNSDDVSLVGGVSDQPEAEWAGGQSVFEQSAPPPDLVSLDEMYHTMPSYDEIDMPMEGSLIVESREGNPPVGSGGMDMEDRRLGGEGVESLESGKLVLFLSCIPNCLVGIAFHVGWQACMLVLCMQQGIYILFLPVEHTYLVAFYF